MSDGTFAPEWVRRLIPVALLSVALISGAELARAGVYTAANCSNLAPAAPDAVSSTNTAIYPRTTDCVGSGDTGMRVTNTGGIGPGYAYGAWSWYAPAGTTFSDLFFRIQPCLRVGPRSVGDGGKWLRGGGGAGAVPPFSSGWVEIDTVPITATTLSAWLECAGATCPHSTGAQRFRQGSLLRHLRLHSTAVTGLDGPPSREWRRPRYGRAPSLRHRRCRPHTGSPPGRTGCCVAERQNRLQHSSERSRPFVPSRPDGAALR